MKKLLFCLLMALAWQACKKENTDPTPVTTTSDTTVATIAASNIKGLNWADPDDNFEDGWVVISGLNSTDNYATVRSKAGNIINGFQQRGANTIRLPVNPSTVLQSWWNAYTGAIDETISRGL